MSSLTRGLTGSNSSTLKAESKLQRCSVAEVPSSRAAPKGFQPLKVGQQQQQQQTQTKDQTRASMIATNQTKATNGSSSNNSSINSNNNKSSTSTSSSSSSSSATPSTASNALRSANTNATHKRQESDSKLPQNFIRGFRRENSDFFPLTKRHSAVLVNTNLLQQQQQQPSQSSSSPFGTASQRASAMITRNSIFNKNDLNKNAKDSNTASTASSNKSTPKLTTATSTASSNSGSGTPTKSSWTSNLTGKNLDFLRPRREKTESVIVLQNSAARQQLFAQQMVQQQQQQVNKPHCFSTSQFTTSLKPKKQKHFLSFSLLTSMPLTHTTIVYLPPFWPIKKMYPNVKQIYRYIRSYCVLTFHFQTLKLIKFVKILQVCFPPLESIPNTLLVVMSCPDRFTRIKKKTKKPLLIVHFGSNNNSHLTFSD